MDICVVEFISHSVIPGSLNEISGDIYIDESGDPLICNLVYKGGVLAITPIFPFMYKFQESPLRKYLGVIKGSKEHEMLLEWRSEGIVESYILEMLKP